MTNYFDKQGNYINVENLSLAEIYHRAFALGVESVAIEDKRPQCDLSEAIKTIKAVCKDHNTCITCPMNWNCNEHPEKWEEMRGGTL